MNSVIDWTFSLANAPSHPLQVKIRQKGGRNPSVLSQELSPQVGRRTSDSLFRRTIAVLVPSSQYLHFCTFKAHHGRLSFWNQIAGQIGQINERASNPLMARSHALLRLRAAAAAAAADSLSLLLLETAPGRPWSGAMREVRPYLTYRPYEPR